MTTPLPPAPSSIRPGEVPFTLDPAGADDARLAFIGRVRSFHRSRAECPKNLREARERGGPAHVEIAEAFRPALAGLAAGQAVHLLTWLDGARRDLALQTPRHSAEPRGTFALRSPVRPNPIGLHLVRITTLDIEAGLVGIDAIDVLDGTPLLDIKPYFESVDVPPPLPERPAGDEAR
ncbi:MULTISPECIES: tRNA (N6-threonylcarbamoyladenosine(37)-N6)-methyltransferase TrmO [unclassified Aureimonas]|uniref:tRNA (N6-threonylcarbamoyladenosine(37)-N6)-methyltransferase TrmO n=1 Tax=unclassified Aureimonas TaxID=2615206 RepID=UPI0006F92B6A|nr:MULTISPECIES: tRNA (N6-threonylcarbamoyladenosine(37)-N6)-methyltransferase TrmO [unclassified Aureimonas]KQT52812.1 tRNA-Thr(GGU) m(6)t(6)A37 methyltransferase TsaA [Aureimonas sp. Leaf427]KQT80272.1 tRNA-Thr(GGU) m(6)t(6)A37 methyltransferase TsaA [Aureimonas sp. Leaf460]